MPKRLSFAAVGAGIQKNPDHDSMPCSHGDVLVRSQVVGFKKIKFFTNENVGSGKLELPENEMHTTAFWLTLEHELLAALPFTLSERQSGIFGLLYALASMATLLLMCDRRDLGTAVGERPPAAGAGINTDIDWHEFAIWQSSMASKTCLVSWV